MDPNPLLWEAIARVKYEELLRQADVERMCRGSSPWTSVGQLLIFTGRWLERIGKRLATYRSTMPTRWEGTDERRAPDGP